MKVRHMYEWLVEIRFVILYNGEYVVGLTYAMGIMAITGTILLIIGAYALKKGFTHGKV